MKLRFVLFLTFIILLNTNISLAQSYKKKKSNYRPALVETSKVEKKTVYTFNESVGRVVTFAPYVISSKINEIVKKIYVLEGENLIKGQKLVELEKKKYKKIYTKI